jgi:hypothetical protein
MSASLVHDYYKFGVWHKVGDVSGQVQVWYRDS